MRGFDSEFTDIVDYILRITYRIWEGKQVGLCRDYYSEDCPVYTLAGYTEGAEAVTQNTIKTLAAFPDRTLHADNIIWGGNDEDGFHTSHLICSNMTNLGPSEFGEATGRSAQIQVIAHCVVRENRIVEEWLVRDNYALCTQLGCDPDEFAKSQAANPPDRESTFARWMCSEIDRVMALPRERRPLDTDAEARIRIPKALGNIWNARLIGDCRILYAENARLHASARSDYDGVEAIQGFYIELLGALPDARISVDYVCENAMRHGEFLAIRWTLAGHHLGSSRWGEPTGAPVLILGESQYRLEHGRVVEEWLVFDELAVLTQIERARLTQ
jgi:predicted ester cyclase